MIGIEHSLTISNEFSAFNVVCVMKIEGRLDPERLRVAFAALQRRHPLLRTRIVSEKGSYFFECENVGPVPVTTAERKSPNDWIAAVEEELDRRMDIASGPLLRCLLLRDSGAPGGESEIILSCNHAILDASSALPLLREFLHACSEEKVDLGPEIADEGVASAVSLFPAKLRGFGYALGVGSYMMHQMADEAGYRWRARGCRKPPIKDSARNRILPIQLSRPLTEALIRATRRERITMNAILTAGLMLAVKRHLYPSVDTPFRNITFADLRPYLSTTVPEHVLGCCMGMCRFTVQMQDSPDFWRLARKVHDTILQSNRRGDRFLANALSPGMMKMIIRMKAMRMGTTALSYAGPVSLADGEGPIRVRGLHAFTTNMTIGPEFSALSRLFQGHIWLDLLYIDSDMDAKKAAQVADEIRQILEQAVSLQASRVPAAGTKPEIPEPAHH